jgi:4-hydroxybenzoate polyprenyltransferase
MQPSANALSTLWDDASSFARPLCVGLDGTLVGTNTLWESVILMLRKRPWLILLAPIWMLGGRARFKRAIAQRVPLDAALLPYREELLAALRAGKERGRKLVLATAADSDVAQRVARHVGLFDEVFSSDGETNLKASRKRDRLSAAYATSGFDYVGDSHADLQIFEKATRGYLIAASKSVARHVKQGGNIVVVSTRPSIVRALFKELRIHQWAKNALVVLPVVVAPGVPVPDVFVRALLAALTFSLCASAGYVFNDLLDLEADRAHHSKRARPFASGALPVAFGPPLFLGLLLLSFGAALWLLPLSFSVMLAIYFAGTMSYSMYLKRALLVDVFVLAALYTHRILAGGIATSIPISAWLLGLSMFLFTSLAFAKRYVELDVLEHEGKIKNRNYYKADLAMVGAMGPASGYLAGLVFSLYIEMGAHRGAYREPVLLWLAVPVLLYWVSRIWILTGRGQMQDDPVKFALRDQTSILCGLIIGAIFALARFAPDWIARFVHG